jgi:hypothetical protein
MTKSESHTHIKVVFYSVNASGMRKFAFSRSVHQIDAWSSKPMQWIEVHLPTPTMLIPASSTAPQEHVLSRALRLSIPVLPCFRTYRLLSLFKTPVIIRLYWQRKLLPLQHLGVVNPEEVGIQDGLHKPCQHTDYIPMSLKHVPVDPIGNVESAVESQCKQVVGCNRLCLTSSLQQEKLGQDGN